MSRTGIPFTYRDKTTVARKVILGDALYNLMIDGSLRRISPERPYRGKSERRQVIKERRQRKLETV
jgi:hypothetical protein